VQLLAMLIGAVSVGGTPFVVHLGSWVRSVCRRLEASMAVTVSTAEESNACRGVGQ
jgi:hypothetical protein